MLAELLLCLTLAASNPSWKIQDSGVATSIRGLSAVNAQVCWFGTKSGVARTVDGGKTWKFSAIGGDDLDFRDLHAFDANRCVAMSAGKGPASRLYLTEDGGKNWKLVHQNKEPTGFFNGIAFRDAKRGVLAGDPIGGRLYLLATEDGGASWHRLAEKSAPKMAEGEHAFAASGTHLTVNEKGHLWVSSGGEQARVFRSTDWGGTWAVIKTPMISGEASTGVFSLAFQGLHGLAVGGDYKKESEGERNLMNSQDGGLTWKLIAKGDRASPLPFRSCIGFLDGTTVVAVGPSGTNISRDGGSSWEALGGEGGFHTMSIAGRTVWAAGAEGRVGIVTLK